MLIQPLSTLVTTNALSIILCNHPLYDLSFLQICFVAHHRQAAVLPQQKHLFCDTEPTQSQDLEGTTRRTQHQNGRNTPDCEPTSEKNSSRLSPAFPSKQLVSVSSSTRFFSSFILPQLAALTFHGQSGAKDSAALLQTYPNRSRANTPQVEPRH